MAKDFQKTYKEKLRTAEEAAQVVKSGYWLEYAMFNGKPVAFDRALAARKDELQDIKINAAVTVPPIPEVILKDPLGEVFTYNDQHFSALTRILQEKCQGVFYTPCLYGESSINAVSGIEDPTKVGTETRDLYVMSVTPMDKDGYFNYGLHNSCSQGLISSSKMVIVEVNEKLPYCLGGIKERVHVSEVDYVIEGENPDLFELPLKEATEIDVKIAEKVMEFLQDGQCIQLGIGSMPNQIGKMIADSDLKDLGGWTEMLVNAYKDMWESGKMNGKRKQTDPGKINYTFCLGGKELYDWVDHNPAIASCSVEYVNDPINIKNNDNFISINQALQLDIYGQINAESSGFRQISGNGGMADFVLGSYWSKGGRSFICMPSTHTNKDGELLSRILPNFDIGTITTVGRQYVNYVVTEYGAVNLKTCPTWYRAEKIISVAHPDFRDNLVKAAEERKIWRRTNKIV